MAGAAFHPVNAFAIEAALYVLNVHVAISPCSGASPGGWQFGSAENKNSPRAIEMRPALRQHPI